MMSGIIEELLSDIPIPKMVKICQIFERPIIDNVGKACVEKLYGTGLIERIKAGQSVAVAVGSRGIKNIALIVKTVVAEIKKRGASPFIVPAMGSHGGATAEGQKAVLWGLGVTEEYVRAPIKSSMEVVKLGKTEDGLPVYFDKIASSADAIVIINRIKPHTAFRGRVESGLMKMITIGLGKQKGAEACHAMGFGHMAKNIPQIARFALRKMPIVFGVGIIENAYDETARIEVLSPEEMEEKEAELLIWAKSHMGKILLNSFDVLIVDEIGKDISGDGMDPNVTGRYPTPYASGGPEVKRIVVLSLTERSHGNANGVGTADFTTRRLFEKMRFDQTYPNALTSTVVSPVKVPMVLDTDMLAIQAAIKTLNSVGNDGPTIVRIKNTLKLDEIMISVNLIPFVKERKDIEILTEPFDLKFDSNGTIEPFA
ncbi:lactate racemase domain-containing protein [Thermoanaerobacterium thermosaccharolyticum]|uniref:lactate racemase domain-containing protein n=1 Tax=Thermoanaerobacterium thermosaccharolyticum TaxID=1517 RepID=UPI003D2DD95A